MLRYPGGKLRLMKKINALIKEKYGEGSFPWEVGEPFVGGGGSLINMAESFPEWRFRLNDANRNVYKFWKFFETAKQKDIDSLLGLVERTTPTLKEYDRIFDSNPGSYLESAFRVLFLNKTSYNGYITQRLPIGGKKQTGKWKVDCYWNLKTLRKKVQRAYEAIRGRLVSVTNLDYQEFFSLGIPLDFTYADPPYIAYGKQWYDCDFGAQDIEILFDLLDDSSARWCMSIDNSIAMMPQLEMRDVRRLGVVHTAKSSYKKEIKESKELVIFKQ